MWGKRYLLTITETNEPPSVELTHSRLILQVRPHTEEKKRQTLLEEWYRVQLKDAVPPFLA